jgi:hypothetical protein
MFLGIIVIEGFEFIVLIPKENVFVYLFISDSVKRIQPSFFILEKLIFKLLILGEHHL